MMNTKPYQTMKWMLREIGAGNVRGVPFVLAAGAVLVTTVAAPLLAAPAANSTVWLDDLDLGLATQGWGSLQKNKSVGGQPLTLGGRKFDRGFGTHAESQLQVNLKGAALRFSASVGVDGEINDKAASVEFLVYGDAKLLWESGVMKAGQEPKACEVDLTGKKTLLLEVGDAGDGKAHDHADWAEAKFEVAAGAALTTSKAPPPGLLTPPVPPTPRINGARVFGVRPGKPCLYTIAASGEWPMRFAAGNLPQGLALDPQTGRITGRVAQPGTYRIDLAASNSKGVARRVLKLVVGELEVWAKEMEDGSRAVGLFNRGPKAAEVTARWKDIGLSGRQPVRDLWRQQDLTIVQDEYTVAVPQHGCVLLRIGGRPL